MKKEEKSILDECLEELDKFRVEKQGKQEPTDWVIRVCEAIVAKKAGYKDRVAWRHLQIQEMRTIRLARKNHVLYIGNSSKDIDALNNITMLYDVSHVVHSGDGFYEICDMKNVVLGFITDVENVEERW